MLVWLAVIQEKDVATNLALFFNCLNISKILKNLQALARAEVFVLAKQSCGADPELGHVFQPHPPQPGEQLHHQSGNYTHCNPIFTKNGVLRDDKENLSFAEKRERE